MQTKEQNQLFQALIEEHKGILYKVARTYCQDAEDRRDLIQEIMIQVWQSFHRYDDKFKISTWLYRISINVAISFYRKKSIRQGHNMPLNEQILQIKEDEKQDKDLHLNMLDQFISDLNDLDKALILLYLEDKSHSDIADILGITAGHVGTKVGRIKNKLKQRFSQQNTD